MQPTECLAQYNEQKERMSESVRKCHINRGGVTSSPSLRPNGEFRPPCPHPSSSRDARHNLTIISKMPQNVPGCHKSSKNSRPAATPLNSLHSSVLSAPSAVNPLFPSPVVGKSLPRTRYGCEGNTPLRSTSPLTPERRVPLTPERRVPTARRRDCRPPLPGRNRVSTPVARRPCRSRGCGAPPTGGP